MIDAIFIRQLAQWLNEPKQGYDITCRITMIGDTPVFQFDASDRFGLLRWGWALPVDEANSLRGDGFETIKAAIEAKLGG